MAIQPEEPILLEDLAPLPVAKDPQHLFSKENGSNLVILWHKRPSRPQARVNRTLNTQKRQIAWPRKVMEVTVLAAGQQEVAAFELAAKLHLSWTQMSFFPPLPFIVPNRHWSLLSDVGANSSGWGLEFHCHQTPKKTTSDWLAC